MIDETVAEIEAMQTHSSSVVAVKAAEALRALFDREYPTVAEYIRDLERNASALRRANPSHASLHTTQRAIVTTVEERDPETVEAAVTATADAIDRVVREVTTAKEEAAAAAAEQFEDGDTILTHDYSSTLLEAIELAASEGVHLDVYVTEARPRFIGRKTVRTLAGIDRVTPHLLTDAAAGHVLDSCDRVVVGMTCIVDETLYNRVGTLPIAATATERGVPVTVVGSSAKIIDDGGFAFENEHRSTTEVMREPAEGFAVVNPAYDATPLRLVDTVVTDTGIETP
ncbi:initiation factor 2B [Halobacteriales archaeon QH_7_65_31]|nr:MAG: initiation factor 2B [Halobacteriales archaeon QH_7_65_31]PSQ30032.1 MAG: initiation factor 2B [Halobacteriales archaeon SW_6_65_46]